MLKILHCIKPRQFGKTWECIDRSAATGAVIVARDVDTCKHILKVAESRGIKIPTPVAAKQLAARPDLVPSNKKIIVDDADCVLMMVLHRDIDMISMVQREPDGTEMMSGHARALMGLDESETGETP